MTGPAAEEVGESATPSRRRASPAGGTKARVRAFRPDLPPDRSSGLRELPVLGRGPSAPGERGFPDEGPPDLLEVGPPFEEQTSPAPALVHPDAPSPELNDLGAPGPVQLLKGPPPTAPAPEPAPSAAPVDVDTPEPLVQAVGQLQAGVEDQSDLTAPAQKTIWVPAVVQDALRAQKDATGMTFTESLLDAFDTWYNRLEELFPPIPKRSSPLPQRRPGRRSRIVGGQALIHMRMSDEEWLVLKQVCDSYLVSSLSEFLTTIYETAHGIEPTYRRPRRG